jgi:hypothetical protein
MGQLTAQGILPLLRTAHTRQWEGALRLRKGAETGTIWFVKGQIVHGLWLSKLRTVDGPLALDTLATWTEGEFLLDNEVLPPDRTIRMEMEELLGRLELCSAGKQESTTVKDTGDGSHVNLTSLFDHLRERVPGLESLSLLNGQTFEATTASGNDQRRWLDRMLQGHVRNFEVQTTRLFIEEHDGALLVIRKGLRAVVLAARLGTSPEALFWAGDELQRQVITDDRTSLSE